MGVIKTLLGVVILVAIVVFGYWLYATYTISSADDDMWVTVNSNLPAPLRNWSCTQVNSRIDTPDVPEGCADVWRASAVPQTTEAAEEPAETEADAMNGAAAEAEDDAAEDATDSAMTEEDEEEAETEAASDAGNGAEPDTADTDTAGDTAAEPATEDAPANVTIQPSDSPSNVMRADEAEAGDAGATEEPATGSQSGN